MADPILECGATRVVRVPQDAQWLLHAEPHDASTLARHAGLALTETLLQAITAISGLVAIFGRLGASSRIG